MSVTLRKIDGIESVNVSLNKGFANIRLKPGNSVRMEQIIAAVRRNGFSPKDANAIGLGQIQSVGERMQVRISGTDEIFDVVTDPKEALKAESLKTFRGKDLLFEGTIPARDTKGKGGLSVIRLRDIRRSK